MNEFRVKLAALIAAYVKHEEFRMRHDYMFMTNITILSEGNAASGRLLSTDCVLIGN